MPKIVDHDAYRHELLSRSYGVFTRLGYAACTMRTLASEIGVSTGTLYHYFPTKEEVFEQLVRQKDADTWAMVDTLLEGRPRPMPVSELFMLAADFAKDIRELQVLLFEFERHAPDRAKLLDDTEASMKMVRELVGIRDRTKLLLLMSTLGGLVMTISSYSRADVAKLGKLTEKLLTE